MGAEAEGLRCSDCGADDCLQIEIRLQDDVVSFFACRNCESKWWEREGDTIALDEVLSLATQRRIK
ncbi:MAG: hypothetical protein ABR505_01380 [Actinomycetota bacterium]